MSAQVRVCIEVGHANEDETWIRLEQVETVIPANSEESVEDVTELSAAAVRRLADDSRDKATDQLSQIRQLNAQYPA